MKINEIIRERRLAKGFTQEQIASYLGVSTPAVNKWENAISYPDITLLPALARLLDTDLNTLLSFKEELSEHEIGIFLNKLSAAANSEGIQYAFDFAMDKIHEYPSCDLLLLNTALTLEGILIFYAESQENEDLFDKIEKLYLRAAKSSHMQVSNQAKSLLISKYLQRQDFEKAKILLDELPDKAAFDKRQLQANLYCTQENWDEAACLIEQKLLSDAAAVQSSLFALMEISLKQNRISDAEQIANAAAQLVKTFDLWEYASYVAQFLLSVSQKDIAACIALLKKMLPAAKKKWIPSHSPLYRHIPEKENSFSLNEALLSKLISSFENTSNQEYDFLREDPEFQKFISDFKKIVF